MKGTVYSLEGKAMKKIDLPAFFKTEPREDLIKRAVLSEESKIYQPKGSYRFAGLNTSARYKGRKEDFGTVKNKGIPHLPHEVLPKGGLGKVKRVPHAVKGRRAHPPKSQKKIVELINRKEHMLALASALSMTTHLDIVNKRSKLKLDKSAEVPYILDNSFENLVKAKDVLKVFEHLKLDKFIAKAKKNNTKAPLIVVESGKIRKAAANLAGVDVVSAKDLKVMDLAPGTLGGRITLFSENALPALSKRFEI